MREILFRAKDAKNPNEWRYGSLIHRASTALDGTYNFYKIVSGSAVITYHDVDGDTVGQYTGIYDKNGVKVFDGDIIRAIAEGEEDIYTVEWCGDRKYPAFDLKPQIDCDGNGLSYLLWVEAEIEVIGNKFDNPELLEA